MGVVTNSSITIIFMCMNGLCWDFQLSNECYNTPLKMHDVKDVLKMLKKTQPAKILN